MRWFGSASAAIALALGSAAGPGSRAGSPQVQDPWNGKPKSDVVLLLGEPSKTKRGNDGTETLYYKLVLLENEATPAPEMLVLNLPGVGLVGRPYDLRGPEVGPSLTIDPPSVDARGRPVGGGVSETESVSTEIHLKTHKKTITSSAERTRPGIAKKITVVFELGPDERVRDWSVAGKK